MFEECTKSYLSRDGVYALRVSMFRKIIPVLLIIAALALSTGIRGDSTSPITFRERGDGMEVSNQELTLTWSKSSLPGLEMTAGATRIPVGGFVGYEIEDVAGDCNFTHPQVVSSADSSTVPTWRYSTSRILSEKGFQVEHVQSVPVSPGASGKVSLSISNVVSDGEVYFNGQRISRNEALQTVALSNWPWANYDNVLAVKVSIGSDIIPEGDDEPLSAHGSGVREMSPYLTSATLVSNGQSHGSIRWSHEAEILTSGSKMSTLVKIYAEPRDQGTDMMFVFTGAYGADKVSYSYILEVSGAPEGLGQYPNYTLPVVSGVVVVLVLATVMFRRKVG